MKKAVNIIIPLLFACIVCSCTENKDITSRLQAAEELMEHHPDSALSILNGIKTSEKLSEGQNALWCLLFTQAQDKNYMAHTSDSIIQIAVRYYEKKKDRGNGMKAYYYNAIVLDDLSDFLRAQDFYLKALDTGKDSDDHALQGRICANLGLLYIYQDLFEPALALQEEAVVHFTNLCDTMAIGMSLRNIGRIYASRNQLDSAVVYYSKAMEYITEQNRLSIHNEIGGLYIRMRNYPEALKHISLALGSLDLEKDRVTIYYNLGDLYRKTGQSDSAAHYLSLCLTSGNIHTKAGATLALGYLEEKRKNWEVSATYLSQYIELQDSISKTERAAELQRIQSLYNYQQVEKDRIFHEMESRKKTTYLYLLSVAFISILMAAVFYYRQRKQVNRERMNKALLIQEQKYRQSRKYIDEKEEEIKLLKDAYAQETDELKKELLATRQLIANKDIEQLKQMRISQIEQKEKFKKSPLLQLLTTDGSSVTPENWAELETWMELIYPELTPFLKKEIPKISNEKLRLCYLILIGGLKVKRMGDLLNVVPSAISKSKERLHKDLNNKGGDTVTLDALLHEMFDKN